MDVFGIGATLQAVLDPTDGDRGLRGALGTLTDPAPAARPSVDEALARLIRFTGRGAARPWPRWADGGLHRDPRRRPRRIAGATAVVPPAG
jgi:hypothetical protein